MNKKVILLIFLVILSPLCLLADDFKFTKEQYEAGCRRILYGAVGRNYATYHVKAFEHSTLDEFQGLIQKLGELSNAENLDSTSIVSICERLSKINHDVFYHPSTPIKRKMGFHHGRAVLITVKTKLIQAVVYKGDRFNFNCVCKIDKPYNKCY